MFGFHFRRRRRLDHVPSRFDPAEWQNLLDSLGVPESAWRLHLARPSAGASQDDPLGTPPESAGEQENEVPVAPDFFQKLGGILREVGGLIAELERERAGGESAAQWQDVLARSLTGTLEPEITLTDLHQLRETVLAFTADPNRLSSLRAIALAADRIALLVDEAIRVRLLIESGTASSQGDTEAASASLAG